MDKQCVCVCGGGGGGGGEGIARPGGEIPELAGTKRGRGGEHRGAELHCLWGGGAPEGGV